MAYSATQNQTEFAGQIKCITLAVTPDAATGTTVLAAKYGISTILAVAPAFAADATANCYTISYSVSGTTITWKLWKAGGTAADTAYVAFTAIVIGY